MGTKLQELRNGCFHAAMDDEPMFVLLARDPMAPEFVEAWAMNRQNEITEGKRPASDMDKVNEARQCAKNMRQWRIEKDGAWREGLFTREYGHPAMKAALEEGARSLESAMIDGAARSLIDEQEWSSLAREDHHITRQNDEYACSCGARWDVADGEEHP